LAPVNTITTYIHHIWQHTHPHYLLKQQRWLCQNSHHLVPPRLRCADEFAKGFNKEVASEMGDPISVEDCLLGTPAEFELAGFGSVPNVEAIIGSLRLDAVGEAHLKPPLASVG